MGTITDCNKCGEKIEWIFNMSHKKIPINVSPSIQLDKATGRYVHVRVSHFVTCENKNLKSIRIS